MKRKILTILFLVLAYFSYSQNNQIDSLIKLLDRPDDSLKVMNLIDIYQVYQKGDILTGKKYLDQAKKIAEKIDMNALKIKVNLSFGNFYNITGDYNAAVEYYNKAKELCVQDTGYVSIGRVYLNLGATYEKLGKYDEAMDCLIRALNVYEGSSDSLDIAKTYLNLGLLYSRQENYKKSLELYNKSLSIRKKLNDKEGIALLYNNIAIINYYLEDYDNVRSYFEKAYEMYVELGNLRRQVMALGNIAEIYGIMGQREKALTTYFKVLEVEKRLGQKGEQVSTYNYIGNIYKDRGDYVNAKKYLFKGLSLAQEVNDLMEQQQISLLISSVFKEESNYKMALNYFEKYNALHDSLFSLEKAKQINEIETQYETKKKEQIIKNLENEKIIQDLRIKKQRIFLFSFFAGFISICVFLIVLFKQNKKIRSKNKLLAYQKKQITDSIEYASRIQTAILPPGDYISRVIPDHFILYKPRDIVSGDFYWITHKDGKIVVAAVDCTGHGVPGAFMSMLGFAFLNEIVNKEKNLKANEILNQLRDYVKESLHQTGKDDEAKDGMDIALCIIDPEKLSLQFSGAYNPLYLIRNEEFLTIKADRMPIGIHVVEKESFTNHNIKIQKDDMIYIFTDGYIDQFGGPTKQKFKMAPFRDLLLSLKNKSMKAQKEILENKFNQWKGDHDQIDDVLIMGIKI